MKRNINTLWIYSAVLLIVAILLITATSLLQAKISVVNSKKIFDQNAQQSIAELTSKYVDAQSQNTRLTEQVSSLQAQLDELQAEKEETDALNAKIRAVYKAYREKRYGELEGLSEGITKEQFEEYIPGFYELLEYSIENY